MYEVEWLSECVCVCERERERLREMTTLAQLVTLTYMSTLLH